MTNPSQPAQQRVASPPSKATAPAGSAKDAPRKTPPRSTLYTHTSHPHTPRNANERQQEERQAHIAAQSGWRAGITAFNVRLAVWLTTHTGTMATAYIFAGIGVGSLVGVFTNNTFLAALFGSISSYFLQLVLLPILSVGQNVLSRHAELQADEQFHATMRTLHDLEQVAHHLDAQDSELLRQTEMLKALVQQLGATPAMVAALTGATTPAAPANPAGARPSRRTR